jgi:3-isopropylmalate dehydrogenase
MPPLSDSIALLILEGDGIGPEIMAATRIVLDAAADACDFEFDHEEATIGFKALESEGSTFPAHVLERARAVAGVVLGPVSHNSYPSLAKGGLNPSAELRRNLDLYANIRPARTHAGLLASSGHPIDVVIVRENTEGFYADRSMFMGSGEFMPTPDVALAVRKVTRANSTRIAEAAFRLAHARRRKVTAVHKANVLRLSDGLFLDCVRAVAGDNADIEYEEQIVDAMAALLVRDASAFDVILTTNMFGDILSDLASEISGSLGLAPSLNAGVDHAVAQAQHGSAPDLAGNDQANPSALIGSAAMLLAWLGEQREDPRLGRAGARIEEALDRVLEDREGRTADLGGPLGTRAFGERVAEAVSLAR